MPKLNSPGTLLTAMRKTTPLVQCITNYVAMNVAANVVLAAGASPAMIHAQEEAGEFAGFADALTINIGTVSPGWVSGMTAAANAANAAGKPWVLDPVAHHATSYRRAVVADLLALKPTIIRGNASEIIALADGSSRAQGVDSRDPVDAAEQAAVLLAHRQACVVAVTGVTDYVTNGQKSARIAGGSDLMPQVTALGCSLTCLIGAFAAVTPDRFAATVAALALFSVAGETAARDAAGPGSFPWRFLDALADLTGAALDSRARISRL